MFHFKIMCPGKIPNIQVIWEICLGNQCFQVGKYEEGGSIGLVVIKLFLCQLLLQEGRWRGLLA